jgi:hypothetical protein
MPRLTLKQLYKDLKKLTGKSSRFGYEDPYSFLNPEFIKQQMNQNNNSSPEQGTTRTRTEKVLADRERQRENFRKREAENERLRKAAEEEERKKCPPLKKFDDFKQLKCDQLQGKAKKFALLKYHPDKNSSPCAHETFVKLNELPDNVWNNINCK